MTDLQILIYVKGFVFFISMLILILSMLTVFVNNAFISVFLFVSTYFFSTFLLILAGAEFLNYIILFVYIGAIAVLFLFAVMNFRDTVFIKPFAYVPFVFYITCGIVAINICVVFFSNFLFVENLSSSEINLLLSVITHFSDNVWVFSNFLNVGTNLQVLGEFLYTIGFSAFVNAGLVLLLAMLLIIRYCRKF